MCFDTESIQTNFEEEETKNVMAPTKTADEKKCFDEETSLTKFESHFNFPPIAQVEDFDLSDEDSF